MKIFKPFLLFILLLMVLEACQKDIQIIESRFEILTSSKWVIDKFLYAEKGDTAIFDHTLYYFKDCELDDEYQFMKDYSFTRTNGANVCGYQVPPYGPYGEAKWVADSMISTLDLELPFTYKYHFTVINLSRDVLELQQSTTDYLQKEVYYTFRFKPKK